MLPRRRSRVLLVVLSIVGLVACGEPEAWVASWSAPLGTITFHDLGTVAPPAVIGGVTMTPFPPDTRPLNTDVTSVPSPLGGDVAFGMPMSHRRIGSGWATWSHGYLGDVYAIGGATSVTLTLPAETAAFYLYVEPDPFATFVFTVNAVDGTVVGSATASIDGNAGARGFAFTEMDGTIESITVSTTIAFAVGELGIARTQTAWFGADTSVHPELDQFPTGSAPYDYYLGQVGFGDTPCDILDVPGQGHPSCTAFQLPAAQMARNTFAYWYLKGPLDAAFRKQGRWSDPYDAGVMQANHLLQQWSWYNTQAIAHDASTGSTVPSPVIDGRTLFGDIEPLLRGGGGLGGAGWAVCGGRDSRAGSDCALPGSAAGQFPANATSLGLNRRLLQGFLSTISAAGFAPGIYTNAEFWSQAFGESYRSPDPFAMWTTSCLTHARTSDEALADFPSIKNTTVCGEQTVVWQYRIEPDYNLASQDPASDFGSQPSAGPAYRCTCGSSCPFNREFGLYLVATPVRLPTGGGTVTISNPLNETIDLSTRSISIDPNNAWYSQTSHCAALPPGGSCTITVSPTSRGGNTPRDAALLIVRPPNAPTLVVPLGNCGVGVNGC